MIIRIRMFVVVSRGYDYHFNARDDPDGSDSGQGSNNANDEGKEGLRNIET